MIEAKFTEITTEEGKRYLRYYCLSCRKYHLIRTNAKIPRLLRKESKAGTEILLWCGKGKTPEREQEYGLSWRMQVKTTIPKRERDNIHKRLKEMRTRADVSLDDEALSRIKDLKAIMNEQIENLGDLSKRANKEKRILVNQMNDLIALEHGGKI